MGQEASLPQGDGQEFDSQAARAPPSSSHPPAQGGGGGGGTNPSTSSSHRNHNSRAAGKMIGAVFHKATSRGGGDRVGGGGEPARNNSGVMRYPTPGDGGGGGQPQPHQGYGVNANGGSHPGVISPGMSPGRPQQQQTAISHPNMMTSEQQQQYYHQQQQQQHQQIYQMQQQQQQQYYHQQPQQQQYIVSPQQPLPPGPLAAQQQPMPHGMDPGGGVPMYNDNGSNNNATSGNNTTTSTKKGMGFKGNGRGAAIINTMRNLSLTGAMQRSSVTSPRGGAAGKEQINEWETKWDEDDDDSDGEEARPPTSASGAAAGAAANAQQQQPLHTPLQRPAMDAAHSTSSPTSSNRPNNSNESLMYGSPMPLQQQQPQSPPRMTPSQQQHQQQPHVQKAHLITATPESTTGHPDLIIPSHQPQYNQQYQQQQPQPSPLSQEDGIEWDTGAYQEQGGDIEEKPNVQMFMPLLRVLGKGSFGKVVLVQKQKGKERGALFAMKILRKTHLVKRRQIERTRTERKVLSVVNHPFIMKLHYAFQSPDKLYLVLDYCPGGELFFHLSRFRRFPERVARFYAAELLLSIGHLHKRGIIYRDLKPENVLLDADGHVKLGDFGLAKAGIKHPCEGATSMCGTPEYMAPEVLSQQGHGFCVDYWGLGMLIYEMMTGLPPWYTTDRAKLFRRLKSAPLDIPSYFSAQAANCVSALLERNPRRRLGVTGIRTAMEHEFFRSISWRALYGKRVEAPIRPCEGWAPPSGETTPSGGGSSGMSGAGPHNTNATMTPSNMDLNSNELDAATANFDNTFTRMPVETEDRTHDELSDEGEIEELHEDTFVGFTFDDDKDRDEVVAQQQTSSSSSRQRTHHTHVDNNNNTRQID